MGSYRRTVTGRPYVEMISGIKLFRDTGGRISITFCEEDRNHADLIRRSRQRSARGEAREILDWASLTGKDALLWQTFRPLEWARVRLAQFLHDALASPAAGFELDPIEALDAARFSYWWRPDADDAEESALEGDAGVFEVDVRIQVGRRALIYVQAFDEEDWEGGADETYPDALVRSLDFGTQEAETHRIDDFYLIAITASRETLLPASIRLCQYRDHPDSLRLALEHRADLSLADFAVLAGRIGWITWAELEESGL